MDKAHQRRYEILAAATLLTLWGLGGLLFNPGGYTDALYEPDYVIRHAPPDGVLAEAGFLEGDSVVAVEGIPVEALGMYSRWPRDLTRAPGDSLHMAVRRDGRLVEGYVVSREPPPVVKRTRAVVALVALAFLWLGIWVLFTAPSPHAGRLALVGLAAGVALPGPYLGTFTGLRDHLEVAGEILLLILLFHFLLLFPRAKALGRSRWVGLLYLPWLVLLGCLLTELVAHPRLYHAFGPLIGILFLGYLVASLVALVLTALTTRLDAWGSTGVGILVAGFAVALVPNLVAVVGWLIPPGYETRGQEWFPYLLVAIPLSLALAVKREAAAAGRSSRPPEAPGPGSGN